MKTIAIIDDKEASLKSFKRQMENALERLYPDWKVIARKPFLHTNEYPSWILENEISVLIIDEQLGGESIENEFADYDGHELVKELRNNFKDLPIYSITSVAIGDELKQSLKYFNLILSTSDFDEDTDNYINLFVKSGINFYNEFQKELEKIGELSEKIARGNASDADLKEIQALQTRLLIPHWSEELKSRESYLTELEKKIEDVKAMQIKLLDYLNKKKQS
jgi:hypothetical protein